MDFVVDPSIHSRLDAAMSGRDSRILVVHGAAGVGKTRLLREWFGGGLTARHPRVDIPAACAPDALLRLVDRVGRVAHAMWRTSPERRPAFVIDAGSREVPELAAVASLWPRAPDACPLIAVSRRPLGVDGAVSLRVDPLSLPLSDQRFGASPAGRLWCARSQREALSRRDEEAALALLADTGGNPLVVSLAAVMCSAAHPSDVHAAWRQQASLDGAGDAAAGARGGLSLASGLELLSRCAPPEPLEVLDVLAWVPERCGLLDAAATCASATRGRVRAWQFAEHLRWLERAALIGVDWGAEYPWLEVQPAVRSWARGRSSPVRRTAAVNAWHARVAKQLREFDWRASRRVERLRQCEVLCRAVVADALAGEPADAASLERQATAFAMLDDLHRLGGARPEWVVVSSHLVEWLDERGGQVAADMSAWLRWRLGRFGLRQYQLAWASESLERAELDARACGDPAVLSRVLLDRAGIARLQGELDVRRSALAASQAAAEQANDVDALGTVAVEQLVGAVMEADWGTAAGACGPVLALWSLGNSVHRAYGIAYVATYHRYRGESGAASEFYQSALENAGQSGSGAVPRGLSLLGLGAIAARTGDFAAADAYLARAAEQLEPSSGLPWLRELHSEWAAVADVLGQTAAARERWARVERLLRERPTLSPVDALLAWRLAAFAMRSTESERAWEWARIAGRAMRRRATAELRAVASAHAIWLGPRPEVLGAADVRARRIAEGLRARGRGLPGAWDGAIWLERRASQSPTSASPQLILSANGAWARIGARHIDFRRRPMLRRLLQVMAQHHRSHSGQPVPAAVLIERIWPSGAISWESLTQRLYALVHQLRRDGFADFLAHDGLGYYLHSSVVVDPD